MIWKEVAIGIGIPIARGIVGWANNALEDGKIEQYEWKKGFITLVRVTFVSVTAFYSLSLFGLNVDLVGTQAGAALFDYITGVMKKKSVGQ